jgi:D-alanine-D-alanine ligase-like ATP-grasp enzyme/methylase of polypeptide subunit release factors
MIAGSAYPMRIGIVRTVGSVCRCAESAAKGLETLGHEPVLVNSEEIELRAPELARGCDLIIDHTDTFRGHGLYRALVRLLLENHGARIVGSDARACFLADNKIAARRKLSEAGISTPPGIIVTSRTWQAPSWLRPPVVLKPGFEHMSRGLRLAGTLEEARTSAESLLDSLQQPVMVESYIPGRELAVSLLDGPQGLQVLPPLEWRFDTMEPGVLTEEFKRVEFVNERQDALRADLPDDLHEELENRAKQAFYVLGLRDYARFDLRLSSGGTLFFLEANTTPSLEPFEALALSAQWAGLEYHDLVERMLSAALGRYGQGPSRKMERDSIQLPSGKVELEIPKGVHPPPPSSVNLARLLDIQPGEEVLDLGCGSGLLSVAAAKLGAKRVVATDLDPRALEATVRNALHNGVNQRVEVRSGSWYEAVRESERFDVIILTPPQTPGPHPFGPKYGGPDGTRHLFKLIDHAHGFLKPGRGRLWLLAISLANPPAIWKRLHERFSEVTLIQETDRPFTEEEYESYEKGLFTYLSQLRNSGTADFTELGPGRFAFKNLFIRASGVREI